MPTEKFFTVCVLAKWQHCYFLIFYIICRKITTTNNDGIHICSAECDPLQICRLYAKQMEITQNLMDLS
jgi:hypothetical protein